MPAAALPPPAPTPEQIRETTREILSRPEFGASSSWNDLWVSLAKALGDWLNEIAGWAARNPETARIVVIVLVVAAAASLIHLLYLALGDLLPFGRSARARPPRSSPWEILEGAARDWREALDAARKMLAAGDYRRAIWLAHRVLLGLLDERGAVRFAGWKTNSHYLRECASGHPWYPTFAELTGIYEQAIYARRPAAPAAVESLVLRVERFSQEPAA